MRGGINLGQIAKVVVDVPAMQTNRPFDYAIPPALEDRLEKGMRVEVPFGSRRIQGFIVDITSDREAPAGITLKEIVQPLDMEPVLNEELLHLGEAMADTVYSFQIYCYQTMLPTMLKAKYEKEIVLVDEMESEQDAEQADAIFEGRDAISWEEAVSRDALPQLLTWRKQGKVKVQYLVKNQARVKKSLIYYSPLAGEQLLEELETVPKRAPKQRELLGALLQLEGRALTKKEFQEQYGISAQTLETGREKGWMKRSEREQYRDPFAEHEFQKTTPFVLNADQRAAYEAVKNALDDQRHETFLLKGVTGSGKTEIYLQLIGQVLEKGQTALMLVPEIALTPQMVKQFKGRFGDKVAVMHSRLSAGEKYDEWRKVQRGEAAVVVGARSSIFAPVQNLGIIIIDEEHELTYKQEDNPRYHARNVAKWRGEYHRCPVVLGSATPSLESRARAQKQVYTLLELNDRVNQNEMPEVSIIDMREEFQSENRGNFSRILKEKIADRLEKKEQVVLLLNRRGYSSFLMCRDCGFVLECPNCDISLTFHMDSKTMKCHYCGHEEGVPKRCPKCSGHNFRYYGTGTQKIETELNQLFPTARIIRMDVDTTRKKGAHERLLSAFGNREADILLGTQMIAKGLDFPNVTLVGVINADTSLSLPDFRSSEKTFQLLTQVSGRAGRAELPGEVIVQTFNPDHYAIRYAQNHNYDGFYRQEMALRHRGGYPPYYFTTQITVSDLDERKAQRKIYEINATLRNRLEKNSIILGPSKSPIAKMKNRYYFQILIKYKNRDLLHDVLEQILQESQKDNAQGLYVSIDMEPMNFF